MTAMLVAAAVFLAGLAVRRPPVAEFVGRYVARSGPGPTVARSRPLQWTPAAVGAVGGAAILPTGPVAGAVIGAVIGVVGERTRARSASRARTRRLGQELPTVADLCALYVLSGDSVVGAMRRLTEETRGVATDEMVSVLRSVDGGTGFPEAARAAARTSSHRDGARFYEILAQAHRSGARLVDSLEMFASDRRAALEREMTAEGGRRALAGYGPILGLMIPTTLLFLMYPTLAGLDALSTAR